MPVALTLQVAQAYAQWTPILDICTISGTFEFRWSITVNFIVDMVLLGIMIWGVLRQRNPTRLWNMLYFQGVFWILVAIMAKLPTIVCHPCSQLYSSMSRLILFHSPGNDFQEHQRRVNSRMLECCYLYIECQ